MILPRTYMRALRMARQFGECGPEARFTAAQATYWFLADNHGGQWSAEYAELCWLSKYYRPGANEAGPCTDDCTNIIYQELGR